MVFQHIEKLKQEYTDKYVIVDATRPELARFKDQTGIVRTVNMSGRALVEFDAYANIGWYDIDVDFLKIIDKPLEPIEQPEKKAAPKAAPAKAKAAPAGGKLSVQDMLAAARAEKSGDAAAESAPEAPAKAKPAAAKMSVQEMLAAARAEKSGGAKAEAAPAPEAPAPERPAPAAEPVAEEAPAEEAPAEAPSASSDIPTDIPGILAYCRKVDG